MLGNLTEVFHEEIKKVVSIAKPQTLITEKNVYQEGDRNITPTLDAMVEGLALPGSGVEGMENFEELYAKAQAGKSCLLLVEHYSNMDLSIVSYLIQKAGGHGPDFANALVAIAGMKLNEDNPIVAAFASAYSRIVIFPSRSLQGLDPEKDRATFVRSNAINRAALNALNDIKTKGKIVLVFPSGTRYRPWDPETKKGIREIDLYIRSFDYMCCVALNGELLHVQKTDMMNDMVSKDVVWVTAGPVQSCKDFRKAAHAEAEAAGIEDKKQAGVDAIMAELEKLHISAEEKRQKLLK